MSSFTWQPGITLAIAEKQIILAAYRFYHGNKTRTAQALGVAIRTLDARLEEYAAKAPPAIKIVVDGVRMQNVEHAMRRCNNNKAVVARALHCTIDQLENELKLYSEKRKHDAAVAKFKKHGGDNPGEFTVTVAAVSSGENEIVETRKELGPGQTKSTTVLFDSEGHGAEPAAEVPAQRPMPVRELPKVQKVLPKQDARVSSKGRR